MVGLWVGEWGVGWWVRMLAGRQAGRVVVDVADNVHMWKHVTTMTAETTHAREAHM